MISNKTRIGIDPGKKGFIAVQIENGTPPIEYYQMPLIGDEIDLKELYEILQGIVDTSENLHAVLEHVHSIPNMSAKSNWSFSEAFSVVRMGLTACGIPYTLVPPKKWQKEMFQGVANLTKFSKSGKTKVNDTKAMALIAAKRLFPNEDLRATKASRRDDDNKVDALLMSEYCKRFF
jgi:hypothetical protein